MIKRFSFVAILSLFAIFLAAENNMTVLNESNTSIVDQELQRAIEQEKKFAKEQTFYDAKSYDFKSSEVNSESVEKLEPIEMDDPSIDSDAILGMSEEEGLSW